MQTRTMVSAPASGLVLQTFTFPVMTFIMVMSTTRSTKINIESAGVPREAIAVPSPAVDMFTPPSPTTALWDINLLNKLTVQTDKPGTLSLLTTTHWTTTGNTNPLQMYKFNFHVDQNLRNVTGSNYFLNNRDGLLNNETDHLNTTENLFIPHLFRALLEGGKTPWSYRFSHRCGKDLAVFYQAWGRNETWAWSLYDSTGKRRPGLLSGTMTWSGNLEQCLSTHVTYSKPKQDGDIRTRFCSVHMTPPPWLTDSFNIPFPVPAPSFITDICALSGCSEHDLHALFQKYISENSRRDNLTVTSVRCYKEKKFWEDIPAVVSLCIIILFLLLVFVGTVYEIILRASRRGVKSSLDIHIGINSAKNPAHAERVDMITLTPTNSNQNHPHSGARSINPDNNPDLVVIPETQDVCSNLDTGRSCSDLEASVKIASADIPVAIIEELRTDKGSSSANKKAGSKKNVRHHDHEISAQNDIDTVSVVYNISHKSDGLQETYNNRLYSTPTSGDTEKKLSDRVFTSSIKSVFYRASLFKNRSLPRIRKRHLQTQLSVVDVNKPSVNIVVLLQRVLVTFSIRRNMTNIFGQGHADMLFCLNGVRVLGNSWIVLGSYFMTLYSNPSVVDNHLTFSRFGQSVWSQFLINTSLSADTFFVISGALNMYNLMKAKAKSGPQNMLQVMSPADYVWGVIHRLFRIIPCYYLALMIHANLSSYLGTGRELRQQTDSSGACRDHWWTNILFISNFYKADEMCMPWSYYLVNDMQLSLLSPLVTIPVLCRPVVGFGLLTCLVALQIVSVMAINSRINGNSMRMATTDYFSQVYVKPYCRVGVYAIGVGLGYLLYSGDQKIRLRKVPLCVGWLLCLAAVFLLPQVTYLQYQEGGRLWSGFETSLYEALSRPVWGLAVSWIIFTCCNSQGGLIAKLLSWNVFLPLARITYAVYVLHPILMEAVLVSTENETKISFQHMTLGYISLLAGSWCLAICMIFLVEQPFVHMEAVIKNHIRSKRTS